MNRALHDWMDTAVIRKVAGSTQANRVSGIPPQIGRRAERTIVRHDVVDHRRGVVIGAAVVPIDPPDGNTGTAVQGDGLGIRRKLPAG